MKLTLILVPTAAPQTVTASTTGPTIVFVTWKHVDCIDRNSEISRYAVCYGPVGETAVNASVSGTNRLAYTAVGLIPSQTTPLKLQQSTVMEELDLSVLPSL